MEEIEEGKHNLRSENGVNYVPWVRLQYNEKRWNEWNDGCKFWQQANIGVRRNESKTVKLAPGRFSGSHMMLEKVWFLT